MGETLCPVWLESTEWQTVLWIINLSDNEDHDDDNCNSKGSGPDIGGNNVKGQEPN